MDTPSARGTFLYDGAKRIERCVKGDPLGLGVRKFEASSASLIGPALAARAHPPAHESRPAPSHGTALQTLDEVLRDGVRNLRFPPELEQRFHEETGSQRLHTLMISGVLVSLLFNWLLLSDLMMIPDVFDAALHWRLFIFTPLSLAGLFVLMRVPNPPLREAMIVLAGCCAAVINTWLCLRSQDALAGPYLVSLTAIVVYCNTVSRLQFRPALVLDAVVVAMYFFGWSQLPDAPVSIMAPAALTLISSVIFTLYGAYTQEHDVRENWLRLMRERLLQDELRQANARLEAATRSDLLTELSSRSHFDAALSDMWDQAQAEGSELSLMLIDVDGFRAFNERQGHLRGDACLKAVGGILKQRLRRPEDMVARFGGEEFIVAMRDTSLQTAVGAAERVRKGVEGLGDVTVSVGVSCMRPHAPHANMAQLLAAADEALHLAKKRGRNCVIAFGTQD